MALAKAPIRAKTDHLCLRDRPLVVHRIVNTQPHRVTCTFPFGDNTRNRACPQAATETLQDGTWLLRQTQPALLGNIYLLVYLLLFL